MPLTTHMDEDALKTHLSLGKLARVYFLFGEEAFLTQEYTRRLIKKAVGADPGDFNLQIFDGKGLAASQIFDAAEALPVFAPLKCVAVRDLNPEELPAEQIDRLVNLCSDVPGTTVLIFSVTGFALTRQGRTKKLLDAIAKAGVVCELKQGTPAQLARLIVARAERAGSTISMADATYLANQTLCNRQLIQNETDKLLAYANGAPITRAMIDLLVSRQVDTSTFALARAVLACSYKQALSIIDELFYQRIEPVAIVSALSMTFLDLHRARAAITAGKTEQEVASDFGYPKNRLFAVSNAFRDARRLSSRRLRECIRLLCEADVALKSTRLDPRVLIEQAAVCMMRSGEGA